MKKNITMQRVYKRSVRYRVTNFIFVLVCLALLVFIVIEADKVLAGYQNSRPRENAALIVDRWLAGQTDELYEADKDVLGSNETREMYDALVREALDGVTSKEMKMTKRSEEKYGFSLKTKDGGSISFELDQKGKLGFAFPNWTFPEWTLTGVSCDLLKEHSYRIRVPSSSTVIVNGTALTDPVRADLECTVGEGLYGENYGMTESLYEYTWHLSEPAVEVRDAKGRVQKIEPSGEWGNVAGYNYDDEALGRYTESCADIVSRFALYTVGLKNVYDMYAKTVKPSGAYDFITEYSKWDSQNAGNGRTEDINCFNFVDLGNGDFGCEVSGQLICSYKTKDDTTQELSYIMIFTVTDGEVKLKDLGER